MNWNDLLGLETPPQLVLLVDNNSLKGFCSSGRKVKQCQVFVARGEREWGE